MSEPSPRTPQYIRIYWDLKSRIEDGSLRPGDRLPPQRELGESYGVTVMTVRQALQLLASEGLVSAQQGSGTFVAERRVSYELGNLRSLAQEIAQQGLELSTKVLRRELVVPHPSVAQALDLAAEDPVYLVERLRLVDGSPIVLQQSHLQPWLGELLAEVDLGEVSLYDQLAVFGIQIARAHETLRASVLTGSEAALLGQPVGSAALLSMRLTSSEGDIPIIHDRAVMVADRLAVTADRAATDVTVAYRLEPALDDSVAAAQATVREGHPKVGTDNLHREESEQ